MTCAGEACNQVLEWMDGSKFNYSTPSKIVVNLYNFKYFMFFFNNDNYDDMGPGGKAYGLCVKDKELL